MADSLSPNDCPMLLRNQKLVLRATGTKKPNLGSKQGCHSGFRHKYWLHRVPS